MKSIPQEVEVARLETIVAMQRRSGKTYLFEACTRCGKVWNISRLYEVPRSGYVCPHCRSRQREQEKELEKRMQEKALRLAEAALTYILLAVIGAFLFSYASHTAEIERGYKALGGEALYILLPLWWFLAKETIKQTKEEVNQQIKYGGIKE